MAKRKPQPYTPSDEVMATWPGGVSGNTINGWGETEPRHASPMFWHPADQHPFGELPAFAAKSVRCDPRAVEVFAEASDHPPLVPVAPEREEGDAAQWAARVEEVALANEADLVGMTTMKERYIFAGYEITHPNVIVLGVAHDYEQLSQVPSTPDNAAGVIDVGRQYARGTRACPPDAIFQEKQRFPERVCGHPCRSSEGPAAIPRRPCHHRIPAPRFRRLPGSSVLRPGR